MESPQVFIFDADSERDAGDALAARLRDLEVRNPLVVASTHARALVGAIGATRVETAAPGADQAFAAELGAVARRAGAQAIVAAGGGRTLDVAKLAAARAGLTIVAVPTQLSHDGICSPVAVVPDATGRNESLGAVAPAAVVISLPTIASSPEASLRAGVGDLLANPLALRDWALAAERGLEEIDQRAWDLSVGSHELIAPYLEGPDLRSAAFVRALADALVMSGLAMLAAGTSRPASGAEHEISHAIDHHLGGRALHGAQVAFGSIVSAALYDEDVEAFRRQLGGLGLPHHPTHLGLDEDDTVEILLAAPDTRPGRFTILEDAALTPDTARALVRRIWG